MPPPAPVLVCGYMSMSGPIISMMLSISSGVVLKPKASASESVVDDDVTAGVTVVAALSFSLLLVLLVVAGTVSKLVVGIVSKPSACARESAADLELCSEEALCLAGVVLFSLPDLVV